KFVETPLVDRQAERDDCKNRGGRRCALVDSLQQCVGHEPYYGRTEWSSHEREKPVHRTSRWPNIARFVEDQGRSDQADPGTPRRTRASILSRPATPRRVGAGAPPATRRLPGWSHADRTAQGGAGPHRRGDQAAAGEGSGQGPDRRSRTNARSSI